MYCPFCLANDTKVVDSRLGAEGTQVRRRRECILCAARFTTYEIVELAMPRVIKRDGRCVQFKEEKLKVGMLRALEKRPVRAELVDAAIARIMFKIRTTGEREIETHILGELLMHELKILDEVAFVRFASVYRRFQDVQEFQTEITNLKEYVEKSEKQN